ncbi:hypothetical protein ACFE04_017428 [Oxalis oulophora]
MGIPDSSLLDLIEKVRSWITWGGIKQSSWGCSQEFEMPNNCLRMCSECDTTSADDHTCDGGYLCLSCGRWFCGNCFVESCKICDELNLRRQNGKKFIEKVHPSASPRESPEPPSPSCSGERYDDKVNSESIQSDCGDSCHVASSRSMAFSVNPSPVSVRRSSCRSDEDEAEDSEKYFYSPLSDYSHSDIDSSSVSVSLRHDFYNLRSVGSSPSDSPSKNNRANQNQDKISQKPLDFENNGNIWYPPPPEDDCDDAESNFFLYDDEDDDIGDSGSVFSSSSSLPSLFPLKEKNNEYNKEPLKAAIQGHFTALVSQLLQGEGIIGNEDSADNWLDILTTLAWQAANFMKPDTSRGGSMDPGNYVKVKCIASGTPSQSTFIKGVVCTKNIKHKRMTTQYKNPRLLLLAGALEYQKVPNQLASFHTLLQQENDHLKTIMSKIEALRPNVLLVEKSVSTYAQEYLLAKEISLVLNVKKPVLERIARCSGALISPSIESISSTRLGNCELFRIEKVTEELEPTNQSNKMPSKTLMFFEGCPRRLGCTILLRGTSREELKKIKHVIQYAIFAAYHLSLETSFLADEGASLPKMNLKNSFSMPERNMSDNSVPVISSSLSLTNYQTTADDSAQDEGLTPFHEECVTEFPPENPDEYADELICKMSLDSFCLKDSTEDMPLRGNNELTNLEKVYDDDDDDVSSEYFQATDTHQSILVSFSSRCVLKGTVCERSRLLRIKFYGCFDKPLGRYLRDDLFDESSRCRSCDESAEAHVLCYTHQQGNLTINVRRVPSVKLPGERDGKIWMWHRCLRCAQIDGVPPATHRVVMSDAAWGLSFGKFLELSFSNHTTANRVATCGHSLQRDCLRYYGFGSMVAFFRYSPIDILSVYLPPSVLEFNGNVQQEWIKKEAAKLMGKMETLYAEISDAIDCLQEKYKLIGCDFSDTSELLKDITEMKDQLKSERNDYNGVLQPVLIETSEPVQTDVDIVELNRLRHALLIGSRVWDHQLHMLEAALRKSSIIKANTPDALKALNSDSICTEEGKSDSTLAENAFEKNADFTDSSIPDDSQEEDIQSDGEITANKISPDGSNLSERIDSAWTGTDLAGPMNLSPADQSLEATKNNNPSFRKLTGPLRVQSFDSALRFQEKMGKSSHFSNIRSFHASGDYRAMFRDPMMRTYSQVLPLEAQKLNLILSSKPLYISSASHMADGARLLHPQRNRNDIVIAVYENDPTSIISYALSSTEHEDLVADNVFTRENSGTSRFSSWQSFGSVDLDYINYGSYGSEVISSTMGSLFGENKKSPHLTISFGDDPSNVGGKVRFSVTCYFAKEFDSLRKKCCPSEVDFVCSMSRSKSWNAQGGKSNVYFAKSLDERFIIKQVKKTELDSFEEFAPEYFKYLNDSLSSGSPTCLAKVSVKHLKGGKEMKMDLMVMENLFFERRISRVYDLKGSLRSRYNSDTTGKDKVLLDMNLLETLRTEPIFLGSKAKRTLERAIWNDTSFLGSVDVMDYSLLVGVDEERQELVLGIIDFMRQYTWDKHLETWVKASGILGGLKNASPTIVSPKQYKKRFRKAMTTYFLTVPDQWSS